MAEIANAFNGAFADNSGGSPRHVPKSEARALGTVIETKLASDIAVETTARQALDARTEVLESTVAPLNSDYVAHAFQDERGFFDTFLTPDGALRSASNDLDVNGLRIVMDGSDDIAATDERGFLIAMLSQPDEVATPATVASPLCSSVLYGVAGEPLTLVVDGLLEQRSRIGQMRATLVGAAGAYASAQDIIRVLPETLGPDAELVMYPASGWDGARRASLPLSVQVAANPALSPISRNVLLIGDSVANHQGALFLKEALEGWGYLPNFVGTIEGSGVENDASDTSGPLGEARPTWRLRQYTNEVTGKDSVPIGGEATYLGGSKAYRSDRNPFTRDADGGDDPSIVKNGKVLDFALYCTRFSVPTPHIVVVEPGINDGNGEAPESIYATMLASETLLISRMRAAWPDAVFLRMVPNTARDGGVQDARWTSRFVPMIRATMAAHAALADPHVHLVPTWCLAPLDAGYALTPSSTDPITGAAIATVFDPLHPHGAARRMLWNSTAYALACACAGQL